MESSQALDRSAPVVSSAFWRISSRVASSAMFGVLLLLLARISPVSAFGQFMVAGAVTTIAGIVVSFGAPARVLRCAAEPNSVSLVRGLYLLSTACNLCLTAVLMVGSALMGLSAAVFAGIVWATGDTLQAYAQNHLAGLGHHRASSWLVATQRIVPFAAVALLLLQHRGASYPLVAAAFALNLIIGAVAPLWSVRGAKGDFRRAVRGAFGWWGFAMSSVMFQLQPPVIAAVASTTVVGLYAMAAKVIGPILLLPASVVTVVIPELARRRGTDGFWRLHKSVVRIAFAYAFLTLILAWPVGLVVTAIAGPNYSAALPLVAGMVIAAGLSSCSQAYASLIIAADYPHYATVCITAGGLVALALLAAFAAWGPVPLLATAPIISESVVLAGMAYAARRVRHASLAK
jgi:O-antigen/teichoic acid export membrane protein